MSNITQRQSKGLKIWKFGPGRVHLYRLLPP